MIKMKQIYNMLDRINNNLEYYYSNVQKINISKSQNGYAIEPVIKGEQVDSFYKNMNKKQLLTALETLNIVIGNCAYITTEIGEKEKTKNGIFLQIMIDTFNGQNLN